MKLKICLLGPIPKGDKKRKDWVDWKKQYQSVLSQLDNVLFVDGDKWKDESKPLLTFGHDANLIKTSDLIITNAENKIGAGTAQEMIIAKYFSKPVITVLPRNSHHRLSNVVFDGTLVADWIHPFLLNTSDFIVETIKDSTRWIKEYQINPKSKKIKNITVIDKAIAAYLEYSKNKTS